MTHYCPRIRKLVKMDYLYHLANASLTLRVAEYLNTRANLPVRFLSVIHQIDGWIVRVKMNHPLKAQQDGDFRAFMNELGIPGQPSIRLQMALWALENGQSPIEVMRRYQIAVVSHGHPDLSEIEEFREQFVQGLGYCPETLA
ncbi:hypothetical protein Oscil6304_5385 [Oscillatoria acuminata PCC 6304]|uniref:Uncharacterized protein n=2 Tax=Oscillatoria acuminata TaxID=118323 RepID=K9TR57_9CYAN|nr:hypothetical protein Oscil6304_5385 [Oscillatoria acuminata PCC 6304]